MYFVSFLALFITPLFLNATESPKLYRVEKNGNALVAVGYAHLIVPGKKRDLSLIEILRNNGYEVTGISMNSARATDFLVNSCAKAFGP